MDRALRVLQPRGPDSSWSANFGWVTVGYTRLAIFDPGCDDGRPTESLEPIVLFNGEIWNYQELANRHHAAHRSERSALISVYESVGDRLVDDVDGVYAVAIVDLRRGQVVVARDHAGTKPVFVARSADGIVVSSDIRAVVAIMNDISLDMEFVQETEAYGYSPTGRTLVTGISQLSPGKCISISQTGDVISLTGRREPHQRLASRTPRAAIKASLEQACSDALLHVRADLQLGLLLSGGLDSAYLAASVREFGMSSRVVAFYVGGPRMRAYREAAERICRHVGIEFVPLTIDLSEFRELNDAASTLNGYSGLGTLATFRAIRTYFPEMKVVLCGEGADELFAGYWWYREQLRLFDQMEESIRRTQYFWPHGFPTRANGHTNPTALMSFFRGPPLVDRHLLPFDFAAMSCGIEVRMPYVHQTLWDISWTCASDIVASSTPKALLEELLIELAPDVAATTVRAIRKNAFPDAFSHALAKPAAPDRDRVEQVLGNMPARLVMSDFSVTWYTSAFEGIRSVLEGT